MTNNLKPWQPGHSGNLNGRPKGARSWHKLVKYMLSDEQMLSRLSAKGLLASNQINDRNNAAELITLVQIIKAIDGDTKAADWLLKMNTVNSMTEDNISTSPVALVKFL